MNVAVVVVIAVAVAAVAYVAACLTDLARDAEARNLPKWAWAVLICVSVPWGGLAYLLFGRTRRRGAPSAGRG